MMTFISKKLPNFIALALFALLLFIAIHIFPVPVLTTPVSNAAGISFALLTDSAGSPFFPYHRSITMPYTCISAITEKNHHKGMDSIWYSARIKFRY